MTDSESDVDWSFQANAAPSNAVAATSVAPAAPSDAVATTDSLVAKQLQLANRQLRAANARAAKLKKRNQDVRNKSVANVKDMLQKLRSKGVLVPAGADVKLDSSGAIQLAGWFSARGDKSAQDILDIGFNTLSRNALAKQLKVARHTIDTSRCLVAHHLMSIHNSIMDSLSDAFSGKTLDAFIVSMAADSTKERLNLPMHEGLQPNVTRSSWHKC